MAAEVSVVIQRLHGKPNDDGLPDWLADLAKAEEATVPEWVRDIQLWEGMSADNVNPASEEKRTP